MPDGENFPAAKPQLMTSLPGIQRDGTKLSRNNYISGEWCRFYLDLPRKMLGYRELRRDLNGIPRAMDVQSYDGFTYVHYGSQNVLQRMLINTQTGVPTGIVDRTPAGFVTSPDNNWQFAVIYSTNTNSNLLVAHAAPNIINIDDSRQYHVY